MKTKKIILLLTSALLTLYLSPLKGNHKVQSSKFKVQSSKSFTLHADSIPTDTIPKDTIPKDTVCADSTAVVADSTDNKKKKEETEYEKLVKKGGTTTDGLFRVRHIEDKYYFEVPDSMIGRYILSVTRLTAVPQGFGQFSGEEVTHCTTYFEKRDTSQLMLRQYVLSHLANDGDNISRTLEQSTVDPIVMAFNVIGRNPEKDASLIEVTNLFKQDNNLTSFSGNTKSSLKINGLQGDRTFIDTMKVFPTNIEIATTRTYGTAPASSPASQTGSITVAFNTSMVLLPEVPMRKRLWDKRVGYFVNNFVRFSDDQRKTQHEAFISRYRLVPKDKEKYLRGELTEPEKQIIYYIDPATPQKWIPYLIQGVNDWNVAFQAAGFKNAIVAKVLPQDDPNVSMEDARYSGLRYLPSETENAYGPHIVDPRSGEIIEAHICWYHNVMNLLTKWYMIQCGPLDKRARTMKFDDELMGQLIRFVSSHEVGHTLGLRHNMGASFATPVEKLRDKKWVEAHGHTASIMDYARFNYVAQPEDNISPQGLFPRINDYDKWAIKWGYQWRPEFEDEYEEKEKLMAETTRKLRGNQRLWFGGEGWGDDARAQTEDLGDNSVKASEYGIKNLKRVIDALPKWTHQDNDQYEDMRTIYYAVTDQFNRYQNHVMRNIGSELDNNMPGEEPVGYVSKERQKEALEYVGRNIFDAPEWLYPPHIINKVEVNPTNQQNARQKNVLVNLLSGYMLNKLSSQVLTQPSDLKDQSSKFKDQSLNNNVYPVPEYLDDLFEQVWKPLDNPSEWKNQQRRQLQCVYVSQLKELLNPVDETNYRNRLESADATLYLLQHFDKVEDYCKQQISNVNGQSSMGNGQWSKDLNTLHYEELLREMKLIRERRTTANLRR